VPGFPGDYRSAGPNQLLRQGAFVVESAADVFEAVPRLGLPAHENRARPATAGASPVLDALGASASHPDEIAAATGLAIHEVLAVIAELEIAGLVVRDASGGVTKVR
jgi:DNA processing protein